MIFAKVNTRASKEPEYIVSFPKSGSRSVSKIPSLMRKKFLLIASLAFAVFGGAPSFAETTPSIAVRAASHETFDRVVFDWHRDVKFQLHRDGAKAFLTFNAAGTLKFPQNVQTSLTRARGFAAHAGEGDIVTVSFTVDPNAAVKVFANDSSVVVDIQGNPAPLAAEPPALVASATEEKPNPPQPVPAAQDKTVATETPQSLLLSSTQQGPAQTVVPPPQSQLISESTNAPTNVAPTSPITPPAPPKAAEKPSAPPAQPASKNASAVAPAPVTTPSAPPKVAEKPSAPPAQPASKNASAVAPAPVTTPSAPPKVAEKPSAPPAQPVAKTASTPAPNPTAATPVPPKTAEQFAPSAQPVAKNATAAAQAPITLPQTHSSKTNNFSFSLSDTPTLVATLDPHIKTRAAIYLRADVGYVVFDRKMTLSPAALENGVPAQIDLQPFDMPKNSGYRFPVPPHATLQATLDGTAWKIFLLNKQQAFSVTTSLVAQPDFALGARFLLPLPDGPDPIRITDPVVGDDLILIPLAQSEAFNIERRLPDFTILPAAQGLVIKPLSDKVIVRVVSDGIEITAEGGLLLSPAIDTGALLQSASKTKAAAAGKSIFDFTTWAGKPGETFTQTRQRLQQTIVDVPDAERNRARLELARFYFAKGDGEEAVSMLNLLVKDVPDIKFHADFMALLGASEILAYRSEDGLRDLSQPSLTNEPEIGLWQAVAFAQLRDWKQAEEKFSVRENILTGYPEPFFSRFFVLAVESALAVDQTHEAADWLHFVLSSPHEDSIEPALNFLRGALDAKAGRAEDAEMVWKEARNSNDRLYKVRAELSLIDLGVLNGSLTPAQAADRLEALRFGWRGDDLEVDILRRLGQFYIQAKNLKAGINTLAKATTLYPSSPLVPAIHEEMAKTFHDIFLGDLGKKLSPLDTLALYNQYHDLLPPGKDGDSVMASLSERLVSIDLLDQASGLLEDLAKNRLQGEEKEHAVLRLAAIRLLDHKPTEALAALDIMGNNVLPAPMQNEQILLRARALSELKRDDEASALLKDNPSSGAMLLRADIAMRAQKWGDSAKILLNLVGPPPSGGATLSSDQAGWLINAAIAYALADDQVNLDKLAIDYGDAMSAQPQNNTFLMLTRPEKTGQMRDLAAAQAQLSQVDMFQGFLNNYRSVPQADAGETAK